MPLWEAKTGKKPTAVLSVFGYDNACIFIDLLTKTNGDTDPYVMRDALPGLVTQAPQGAITQNANGVATVDAFIVQAIKMEDGTFAWEPIEELKDCVYPGHYVKPE